MKNKHDISVVMAVRDAEQTLSRACQSLFKQSLPAREILLILNGCQDDSAHIASELAAANPTVRILKSATKGGVALAAKTGCEQACYPLIARMDADDFAHPQRLEHQLATLKETNADLVTCKIKSKNSLGAGLERFVNWANTLSQPEDFLRERFIETPVIQPGVLMKRTTYLEAGGYEVKEGPEDYDLWLRMLAQGALFFQAPEAILHWYDSDQRLTRSHQAYSEARMTATKAHYLAQIDAIKKEGVVLAGSGPIGRRLGRLLIDEGVTLHGFFDVAPRKIGGTVLGSPVMDPQDLGAVFQNAVLLGCVGRGGRERVRILAKEAGYHEGENFFACC